MPELFDDVPLMSKEDLVATIKTQRKELSKRKRGRDDSTEICDLKKELVHEKAMSILGSLRFGVDFNDWFSLLSVNPLLDHAENETSLKNSYRKLSLLLHPDKNTNSSAEDVALNGEKTKKLNEAYKIVHEKEFKEYREQCWKLAQQKALEIVVRAHGKL